MKPVEWSQVKDRVESLWGKSQKWGQAATLSPDVTHIPMSVAMDVVNDLINLKYPPSPAEVINASAAHLIGGAPIQTAPGQEDCNHPDWAVVEYLPDNRRRGMCRVCRLERLFPVGALLIRGEVEDKRLTTQVPKIYEPEGDGE